MDPAAGENSLSSHRPVSTDGDQSICHHSILNVDDEANKSDIVCSGHKQQFKYTPQHSDEAKITDRHSGYIAARQKVTNTNTAPHTPEEEHSPFGSPGAEKTEGCAPSGCSVATTRRGSRLRFSSEDSRRRTFENSWNSTISVDQLVESGLYYTGESDMVRCFHCNLDIRDWKRDDDPFIEHFRFSQQCQFLWNKNPDLCSSLQRDLDMLEDRPTGRHEVPTLASNSSQASGGSSELRQGTRSEECAAESRRRTYQCLNPLYNTFTKRMTTFDKWPLNFGPTAQQFAEAGFYYTGDGDTVECVGCGKTLGDWEPEDDPIQEHRRWYPVCSLLKTDRQTLLG